MMRKKKKENLKESFDDEKMKQKIKENSISQNFYF